MQGNEEAAESIAEWLTRLEVCRRLYHFYEGDHPATVPARRQLIQATQQLSGASSLLRVTKLGFELPEIGLPKSAEASRKLAVQLSQLGIVAVSIRPPVSPPEVGRFVELVADLKDRPTEDDRSDLLRRARELDAIDLVPLDVDWFVFSEQVSESALVESGLWQDLVASMTGGALPESGVLSPGEMARMVDADDDPQRYVASMVVNMVNLLDEAEERSAYFDGLTLLAAMEQVLGRIHPDNQLHAVRQLLPHAMSPRPLRSRLPEIVPPAIMLEGVNELLDEAAPVPDRARTMVSEIASGRLDRGGGPHAEELSPRTVARAQQIQLRMGTDTPIDVGRPYWEHPALQRLVAGSDYGPGLGDHLDDHELRGYFEQVLGDAYLTAPAGGPDRGAGAILLKKYFGRLELGEFSRAAELARVLKSRPDTPFVERMAGADGLNALLDAMSAWGKEHRNEVALIIAQLGVRLVPAIIEGLETEESMSRRRRMLEMAIAIGSPAAPRLHELLEDERWYVVRNAILMLRKIGDPSLAARVKELSAHPEPRVVSEVVRTLITAKDSSWLQVLRNLLAREDETANREALAIASRIPHQAVAKVLIGKLQSIKGTRMREQGMLDLVHALGGFRFPEVTEELMRLAELPQWKHPFRLTPLWEGVAKAAARQGTAEADQVLEKIASFRDPAAEVAREQLVRRREGSA